MIGAVQINLEISILGAHLIGRRDFFQFASGLGWLRQSVDGGMEAGWDFTTQTGL
jgi:hypothetical protein